MEKNLKIDKKIHQVLKIRAAQTGLSNKDFVKTLLLHSLKLKNEEVIEMWEHKVKNGDLNELTKPTQQQLFFVPQVKEDYRTKE